MRSSIITIAAILVLTAHCGVSAVGDPGAGGAGGSTGPTGGTGGTAGGTGGTATGGTAGMAAAGGTGGTGTGGYNCAVGGSPPYCEGEVLHPANPMCQGVPAPADILCTGSTPLCSLSQCKACPGSGGPAMVSIGSACVDETEVTRSQYQAWLATSPVVSKQLDPCLSNLSFAPDAVCMSGPDVCASGCDDHPQTCVDWCDATAYCAFVGKKLCGAYGSWAWKPADPTALGEACHDGTSDNYPYGPILQPNACNGSELAAGTSVPVGSLKGCAREHGDGKIFDLTGNVWEWQDLCPGSACAVRGGSYKESSAGNTCTATTSLARDAVASDLGFRCCAE
ncbi:MAG: SUMF1/EgtB/PvdO family nonheme iron enzyme [Deltaproteobacteria bacterium]|nr:SUMF1/EgtB/PvdO family nonheme iron enzyme [Deltaproteobacteria bacterium]